MQTPPLTGDPGGFVTYSVGDRMFRRGVSAGATTFDLTASLNALSPGEDGLFAVSRNGAWLTLETSRFGCQEECLARVNADISAGELVRPGGQENLTLEGRAAISDDGTLIVYTGRADDHVTDLYVTRETSPGTWSAPVALSLGSGHDYNEAPVLNHDGTRVLFDCSRTSSSQAGTDICEIGVDGSGFRVVVESSDNPVGPNSENFLARHADYFADGSVAFEADWDSEQIWVLRPGQTVPRRIQPDLSNDNSPCVLPGGYVASLWLGRPEGIGLHELKVTDPTGVDFTVLTPDVDINDIGMSCHGPTE